MLNMQSTDLEYKLVGICKNSCAVVLKLNMYNYKTRK